MRAPFLVGVDYILSPSSEVWLLLGPTPVSGLNNSAEKFIYVNRMRKVYISPEMIQAKAWQKHCYT